jgi:hypothetical protein
MVAHLFTYAQSNHGPRGGRQPGQAALYYAALCASGAWYAPRVAEPSACVWASSHVHLHLCCVDGQPQAKRRLHGWPLALGDRSERPTQIQAAHHSCGANRDAVHHSRGLYRDPAPRRVARRLRIIVLTMTCQCHYDTAQSDCGGHRKSR